MTLRPAHHDEATKSALKPAVKVGGPAWDQVGESLQHLLTDQLLESCAHIDNSDARQQPAQEEGPVKPLLAAPHLHLRGSQHLVEGVDGTHQLVVLLHRLTAPERLPAQL